MVELKDTVFPEFSRSKWIDGQWAFIFYAPLQYDIIFGQDLLLKIRLDTCLPSTHMTNWLDQMLSMKKTGSWEDSISMYLALKQHVKEHENKEAECECFNKIMDATKYERVDPQKVPQQQTHLMEKQCKDLAEMWLKHEPLFDGTLGCYPDKQSCLELLDGAEPVQQKAYPVTHARQEAFQKELKHLIKLAFSKDVELRNGLHQHSSSQRKMDGSNGFQLLDS
jgi:hypothetical protein